MNVLIIMGDHLRHDAMGWTGNRLAVTPNLDRLAADSVRFRRCFNQSPVCSPARHSLNTGQYVHRHGVTGNHREPFPGMFTLAHALKPHGYRCFHQGHMHWNGLDNGYEPEWTEGWVNSTEWVESLPKAARSRYEAEHAGPIRRTTGGPSPRKRDEYNGHFAMTRTIEQIEEAVADGEKFLAWCAFSEPHPPFYPPKEFYELIDQSMIELPEQAPEDAPQPHAVITRKEREWAHLTEIEIKQIIAGYYGLTAMLDTYVGEILDTLERLGVMDDTIIIWSSDHGDQLWENRLFLKFITRESSVRVPLMVRVPGGACGDRNELVEHVDLFPTVCELLGVPVPESVQGRSLAPLLGGRRAPSEWRDAVFSQIHEIGQNCIRMVRTDDWKLNVYDDELGELYDLRTDPCEHRNLIDDPAHADKVRELHSRLLEWYEANAPG